MSRVKVDITADKSGFESAIKGVEHNIEGLKHMVVGAFSVEAVKGIVEKTFEYADTIDKASQRMKMTTEETQALSIVAKDAGSSLETIEGAFRKIEAARAKALGGNAKALAAFKVLGIDTKELQKPNNTMNLAGRIGKAAAEGSNDTEGVALQGLGLKKSAGDLAVLGDSLTNFGEKIDELKGKGAIMEDKDIANIVRAKDELEVVGTTLMAQVAPWLSQLIEGLEEGWILFSTTAENVFTAIILMAEHTVDYIKDLGKGILNSPKAAIKGAASGFASGGVIGAVTGFAKGAVSGQNKATENFVNNIANDAATTLQINGDEINKKLTEYNQKIKAQMDARAKARENKPEKDAPVIPPKQTGKGVKMYSDELTKSGNLLGASFKGAGMVTTALDVSKQQLAESKKQTEQAGAQTELLQTIANNTEQNDNEDSWP